MHIYIKGGKHMRLSRAPILTSKNRLDSNEMLSQQILFQSGQVKRYGAGIFGKNHFLVRAQANIENLIREVLDRYDCIEIALPVLQPTALWELSGRLETYRDSGELFVCYTANGDYCVAPTAEEAVIEFVRDYIKSYKDLPVTVYQIALKFRNEIRSRGGMLRTKEFTMMDAYSFHVSEECLQQEYNNIRKAYLEIFQKLDLDVIPVGAVNGQMGGDFSEEFMLLAEKGGETILTNEDNSLAFNTEILESDSASSYLKNFGIHSVSQLVEKRCIEVGHIFQLGQRYSIPMNATVKDKNNQDIPYYMGCYGIGTSRTLATICEANCDEKGLYWPKEIAPYRLMIVYTSDKKELAFQLYHTLLDSHLPVIIDDRNNLRLGSKIKDWELFGIPYLLIIGNNTHGDCFELESRKDSSKRLISLTELLKILS